MRIAVCGSRGMLGRAVLEVLNQRGYQALAMPRLEISDYSEVSQSLADMSPEVCINCAGAIPLKQPDPAEMVRANALGPFVLAKACGHKIRLVHVSTDCVFSGKDRDIPYSVISKPDADDIYGRSKAIGEMIKDQAAVVRTSFIGPDHGLLRWLLDQPEGSVIEGWIEARWTGSSVYAVARGLVDIAEAPRVGLIHLSTPRVYTKALILQALVDQMNLKIRVQPVMKPHINRALKPTFVLPSFNEVIEELCSRSLSQ